ESKRLLEPESGWARRSTTGCFRPWSLSERSESKRLLVPECLVGGGVSSPRCARRSTNGYFRPRSLSERSESKRLLGQERPGRARRSTTGGLTAEPRAPSDHGIQPALDEGGTFG